MLIVQVWLLLAMTTARSWRILSMHFLPLPTRSIGGPPTKSGEGRRRGAVPFRRARLSLSPFRAEPRAVVMDSEQCLPDSQVVHATKLNRPHGYLQKPLAAGAQQSEQAGSLRQCADRYFSCTRLR
jgi:hypothetical protein